MVIVKTEQEGFSMAKAEGIECLESALPLQNFENSEVDNISREEG